MMSSYSSLHFHHDRVHRLVEEALEVALVLCNTELREFSVAKIFDIFNQILPTAFIIGTSYWPYYHTLQKQKLCVCARYGIYCRHFRTRTQSHFIDLDPVIPDGSLIFCIKKGISVIPSQYLIDVIPLMADGASGYSISMKFTLTYQRNSARGLKRAKKDEHFNIPDSVYPVSVFCRYHLQREYYRDIHTIRFEPNPFFYETYGSLFPRLVNIRPYVLSLNSLPTRDFSARRYMQVYAQDMPDFTLVLHHAVNMPLFANYSKMVAVPAKLDDSLQQQPSVSRGTQTPNDGEPISNSYGFYRDQINNLRSLWNNSRESRPREEILAKIQELSEEDDLQETTVTTTNDGNNNDVEESVTFDQFNANHCRSTNYYKNTEVDTNNLPKLLSPMGGSTEKRNKQGFCISIEYQTKDDDRQIGDESKIKIEKEFLQNNSCTLRFSNYSKCSASNSMAESMKNYPRNWAHQKFDDKTYQQGNHLFQECSVIAPQRRNTNGNWTKWKNPLTTNQHGNSTYSSTLAKSNEVCWRNYSSGTNYDSNKMYDLTAADHFLSYAQPIRSNCPATLTSGDLNFSTVLNNDLSSNENKIVDSSDSTSNINYDDKLTSDIKNEACDKYNNSTAPPSEWMSSHTPIDYIPTTSDEINQHFQDMEEIIQDDMVVKVKEETIDPTDSI